MDFYQQVDHVFQQLHEKYGLQNDQVDQMKKDLIYVYDNEETWRAAEILKYIKPKHWYIDEKGEIHSVPDKRKEA